ncbi:hypothetical protein Tco_0390332 [Tanacetum coccineum]
MQTKRCDTLKGSIQGNKSDSCRRGWKQPNCANFFWYMQRGNRHAAIALVVQNEFPLAYHAVCCRHLMMNLSLKRDKTKALFWKICKAYTTEEFSSSVSHLQDIQSDAKLPVIKLAETYRAMVQDCLAEMMKHVITNYTSDSEDNKREVTQNDYTFNQMVEWAEQEHFEDEETKLSCPKIDLSTSMADSASDARKTIVSNLQRELEAEATLANTMLGNLTRYSEQMRIREIQITMLKNMPTNYLTFNSYGLHALLMTHEADIRTTNNLIRARQELLRSIAEKQNFINNYRAI